MYFETELSEKLNRELEADGICVSEALIAKTLAAAEEAREIEENANQLIELASARKRRIKDVAPVLFRVVSVAAACFVLVVGGFALRFSTMRMGSDSAAPMATRMTAESESIQYSNGASEEVCVADEAVFDVYGEPPEAHVEASDDFKAEMYMTDAEVPMEPIVPTEANDEVSALIAELEQAEYVELEEVAAGSRRYRFVVREDAERTEAYLIYEDGAAERVEATADGETVSGVSYDSIDSASAQRTVLIWMKRSGYEF